MSLDIGHLSQFGGESCTDCVELIRVQCSQCHLCRRIESVSCLLSCLLRRAFARGDWVEQGLLWLQSFSFSQALFGSWTAECLFLFLLGQM
jgi:hypothetical protein